MKLGLVVSMVRQQPSSHSACLCLYIKDEEALKMGNWQLQGSKEKKELAHIPSEKEIKRREQ